MRNFSPQRIAAVFSTALILSSCQSLQGQLKAAGAEQGKAAARVELAPWPSRCRVQEPHAPIVEGAEVRSILVRERAALDKANGRITSCATFYDDQRQKLQ